MYKKLEKYKLCLALDCERFCHSISNVLPILVEGTSCKARTARDVAVEVVSELCAGGWLGCADCLASTVPHITLVSSRCRVCWHVATRPLRCVQKVEIDKTCDGSEMTPQPSKELHMS